MKDSYMIIISLDAVDTKDFEILRELPNFKRLSEKSSYSKEVDTVYPSLTYPAHTTIVTGKYPNNHGIINNTLVQPGNTSPDWFWHKDKIQGKTIYDLAKEKGLKTAALLWPVTAKANIDYNLPEIFANRWWQNQILVSLANGSKAYQFQLNSRFRNLRNGINQPELDNFVIASLLHTLRKKQPELIMVHLTDVDSQRHQHGYSSPEALYGLKRHDSRIGEILNCLQLMGIQDETTIVVLGDHSCKDTDYVIKLNKLFIDKGWIVFDNKGRLSDWIVFMNSCDGSAYIYLKDNCNLELLNQVKSLIEEFSKNNNNCIEEILIGEEACKVGADKTCALMLEAKEGYYFVGDFEGQPIEKTGNKYYKATHGYSTKHKKDYKTFFMISGSNIKKDFNIGKMHLVDEGPTIAKLLGGTLPEADGKVINHIFV